eukprot:12985447-Alexandrium_andersonii.AAC.1
MARAARRPVAPKHVICSDVWCVAVLHLIPRGGGRCCRFRPHISRLRPSIRLDRRLIGRPLRVYSYG